MSAEIIPIDKPKRDLWSDYIAAQKRAQATGDIEDGMAAGRAWRRWLDCFMTTEQRQAIDSCAVIGLRR